MIEARDLPPVPRAARMKTSYAQARRGWMALAVVVALASLGWLGLVAARQFRLATHGVTVQGQVIGRRSVQGKGSSYSLTVEFPDASRTVEDTYAVSYSDYADNDAGATIPVVVDPADPTNSALFGMTRGEATTHLIGWVGGWLALGIVVALGFWGDASTVEGQRRMLTEWPLGAMTVDRILPGEAKQTGLFLAGHLTDADGKRRVVPRLHLPTGSAVGESVPVLYDELSEKVVALASLDKVELAPDATAR